VDAFRRSVQMLLLLADSKLPLTSPFLAAHVGSDPSVVRETLVRLSSFQITKSQLGPGGGASLHKPAETITVGEVYLAVGPPQGQAPSRGFL
jgi:DNA-binding IscR family transcriptional regulator